MCWAEKCCYIIPAKLACVMLGVSSFILSTFIMVASVTCYFIEVKEEQENLTAQKVHVAEILGLKLNMSSVHILLSILILVSLLWMMVSVMLVVGVVKNKPCFVLSYFSYGIIVTILCQLGALLILLKNCWLTAIILFIISLVHIHFLVVVHTVYELMQRGKDFSFQRQRDEDEDPLADCFDESTDII